MGYSSFTGTNSSKHKVYRIGQTLDNRTKQIWEKIKKKNKFFFMGFVQCKS